MLDNETKRRIDSARDILVGKVPDPKSQVEQITIALIYKFMDDMDREAVELGGQATFFRGEYAKYSWTKLFDPKLGGHEVLNLYGESIVNLNLNPGLPQLFRDIFKNAYLPYRDPETLKLFLKIINGFEYDHSERLGDAFEYLLSVLGAQGDAGQFRTPRHIIDFVVQVVQPQKHETICDPACGTAGFLISAYKYILEQNKKKTRGDLLTPDEKRKLMQHFTGYDISPDMVRLSLVNMYLHNFTAPRIYEYDTLTSEDRWGESFDLVLANPPFMSPKGGIKPHKKFSLQANRSEVLFVDYIAEHINPVTGRAGIIVPEGIIFQSGTAYKALRKMLVDKHYLYAVVSLPAGVFQPYSGVKTSILLMDKSIARKTDNILFVKIEADGFDLGAQRRPVKRDDLPMALGTLLHYKEAVLNEKSFSSEEKNVLIVAKEKIKTNADYSLSLERYSELENKKLSIWEMVKLRDVLKLTSGRFLSQKQMVQGKYPVYGGNGINGYHNEYFIKDPVLLIGRVGAYCGAVHITQPNSWITDNGLYAVEYLKEVNQTFLALILQSINLNQYAKVGGQPSLSQSSIYEICIPLPPPPIQQEIVTKIESYQRIIDGAKQVVENYKPQIDIDPEWEMVELSEVSELNPKKNELKDTDSNTIVSFVPMADLNEGTMEFEAKEIKKLSEVYSGYTYFKNNDVLLAKVTPCFENGKAGIARNMENGIGFGSSEYYVFRCSSRVLPEWIYFQVASDKFRFIGKLQMTGTGGLQRIPKDFVLNYKIPIPQIEIQKNIIDRIEKELLLVNANRELIKIYEQRIKDEINKLWQEDGKGYVEQEEQLAIVAEV
jgi:type I restriction enzyme M protein